MSTEPRASSEQLLSIANGLKDLHKQAGEAGDTYLAHLIANAMSVGRFQSPIA